MANETIPPQEVHVDTDDDGSTTSSLVPSRCTERLKQLFPSPQKKAFPPDTDFISFLQSELKLEASFLTRMVNIGISTPCQVVNAFGLDTPSIAKSFAKMGKAHVLDPQGYDQNTRLLLFARGQILNFKVLKEDNKRSWHDQKKKGKYNQAFKRLTDRNKSRIVTFVNNESNIILARHEMSAVRKMIRKWVKNDACSVLTTDSASVLTRPSHQSPGLEQVMKVVGALESKIDAQVQQLHSAVKTIPDTVEKHVTSALKGKGESQHTPVASIRKKLEKELRRSSLAFPVEELSMDDVEEEDEQRKEEESNSDDSEEMPPLLPRTSKVKGKNRRSSFYRAGNRRGAAYATSPFDVEYEVGCNDDLFSNDTSHDGIGSLASAKKAAMNKTREWLRKQREDAQIKFNKTEVTLKRSPLPTSVVWNGKGGIEFEKFLDKFTGHVKQQQHMSYILKDEIAVLWMKHGNPQFVIRQGIKDKIHPSLNHISPSQFTSDTIWLFGAMQQAITGRGKTIIKAYQSSEDGILCWQKFLETYRYDGDVAVYLSMQHQILSIRFSHQYQGGMLQFLEDYESAFMNIEHVMSSKPSSEGITGLYTDQGKRNLFVQNFTVPDLTAELIESVEATTETWDDMVNELRHRLAKRTISAKQEGKRKAHMTLQEESNTIVPSFSQSQHLVNNTSLDLSNIDLSDNHLDAYVHAVSQDWNVGYKLWQKLTEELKKKIMDTRRQHLSPDSGGYNHNNHNGNQINQKPKEGPRNGNSDIVKSPPKDQAKTGNIPMQYSSNNAQIDQESDEDVQTFLSFLDNGNFHVNNVTIHAHTNYWMMLAKFTQDLSVADSGADSHVVGKAWLILTPTSGPGVRYANVIGFDEHSAKKFGLPIVSSVTKAITSTGKTVFLRALHSIYNATSPHTLLSNFEMREVGLIVDAVTKRHLKDSNTYGTHSIQTPSGHVIDLKTRGALPTFDVSKPTLEEYRNAAEEDIIDIALQHWNPQDYYEELMESQPPVSNNFHSKQESTFDAMVNFISNYQEEDGDPYTSFMDCAEFQENQEEFYDTMTMDIGEEEKVHNDKSKDEIVTDLGEYKDCQDYAEPSRQGKVMHLTLDYQQTRKGIRGLDPVFISSSRINSFLSDLDYNQLTGKSQSFDTLVCALSTVEKLQQVELLQPRLAWKPLEVIKKTLENTTQWGRPVMHYPMRKHHASRFPWNNRRRLREEVAMDTIFMKTPGFDGSTCAQVFLGLMSRMLNVYPMPSKASGYIFQAYQDFMRYEGVPEGLHSDLAPEQKVDKIISLNRDMMVKDTWSERGNPNQNPVEAQGINPLKKGAEQVMNRTGAKEGSWPWVYKYIAQVNNICASPVLGWKTPISVRHGYTPDISAYLQYQFWEKIYFKIDDQSPSTKEAPGYWLGVSETVGDMMTYDIWSDKTNKVIQRSVIRSADPNRGGIPNLRTTFQEEEDEADEPEIVTPSNILDKPGLTNISPPFSKPQRTKKHKVKWHDTMEAPHEIYDETNGFEDANEEPPFEDAQSDFSPKMIIDDLPQSHPMRRDKLKRKNRKTHLVTASALMTLATTHAMSMFDSGCNLFRQTDMNSFQHSDPFYQTSEHHILETTLDTQDQDLSQEAFIRKMQLQYFDAVEDSNSEDWSFVPIGVVSHKLSSTPRRKVEIKDNKPQITVTKERHVRVKTCWRNGETSWVAMNTIKEQNPWVLVHYARKQNLTKHPDFKWINKYVNKKDIVENIILKAKSHQGQKFKFGVQIPVNASHALYLDKINNNTLWQDAINKELESIKKFKTFRILDKGEKVPDGYVKIPYHIVLDNKFDGRRKARLVAGGNHTPDVPPEEVYSGVVSMETIRTAFVLAALNNLEVCAADISTAFLYGKTREKVYIVAGKEFGEHQGKQMIIEGGLYGLKTSAARFHESLSSKLRRMGFQPCKADFDLWMRPQRDHYEYVATYVDDVLVFSRDPMQIIEEIKEDYELKGIGRPEYYLGGNFHTTKDIDAIHEVDNDDKQHHLSSKWLKEGVKMAFSARTYIEQSIDKLETMMGQKAFTGYNTPMAEGAHPELDDSPMLDTEAHSKFRSLIGCANWLVTLGRFDIAYSVNAYSRFSQAPRQGHLDGMIRVFGYLKKWSKGTIMIDPKYPDHSQFDIADYEQWSEFYPDAEEIIPGESERPTPTGPKVRITVYKDADHAHDILTRRSVTGVLLFLNNTPVKWISQRQKTVETSTYGSKLVAAKTATELILEYRHTLRMMGSEPDGPALMLGDNNSVVLNCTMPNSVLKKKHAACSYHRVREAIAAGIMKFSHVPSDLNYADMLTKPVSGPAYRQLVQPLLFRVPME